MKGTLKLYCGDEVVDMLPYTGAAEREEIISYWKQLFDRGAFEIEVKEQMRNGSMAQ